ncbi:phage tail assembly chaperone [Delftia lacustris]|uniref:phage tail assembly chaperone n=1 Tax=Delftia lacustris TaxID=558537 RepID=UPI002D77393C|nr:phage tail assembly chaperone [Delftia lacustris]
MAVILASCAFWAPVKFVIPGDDAKPEIINFKARFKRLSRKERKALERRVGANSLTAEVRKIISERLGNPEHKHTAKDREEIQLRVEADPIDDDEFLREVLVDWDLKDKQGKVVVFSLAALEELADEWDGIEPALVNAYFDARRAATSPEAVQKNSDEPSATTTT